MHDVDNYNWSDKTILLVDDNEMNYILVKELIEDTQALLLWVKNGFHAIGLCSSESSVDLVLMDFNLPYINGLKATSMLLKFQPMLTVLGFSTNDNERKFKEVGALGFEYGYSVVCKEGLTIWEAKFGEFLF